MATALYRRYRPETFTEMIGQSHVTEPLMTALRSERVGHAYLFSGPRGCGKTTSARVLARCLNCAAGPADSPCGVCPSCVELSRDGGGSLDVVEIDAASHGGVDDARELRERAVFAPARDRFKIFIIDEAHMVTPAGFNALLKIVEEPPPHVKFIFATTEPEKVIGTIRSRTHHYPFRLIAPGALIDYAQSLCDSEGITVEPGVLPLVVRAGGGSVRDTLSILDQLIAGSEGTTVTTHRASGLLGFTSTELIDEVVNALAAADSAAAFAAVDRVVQTGQDPRRFVEDLLERLRDLIVIGATSVDGAAAVFRGVPEAQLNRMFQQSLLFARGETSRLADLVSSALDSMAGATAPRLQLELLIARALVGAATSESTSQVPAAEATGQKNRGSQGSFAAQLSAARASAQPQQQVPDTRPAPAPAPVVPDLAQAIPGSAAPVSVPPAARSFDSGPLAADMPPSPETYPDGRAPSDYVNAMKTARDFLKNDDAGTEAKPAVPATPSITEPAAVVDLHVIQQSEPEVSGQQAPAPVTVPERVEPEPVAEPVREEVSRSTVSVAAVTLADLHEVWAEILEELQENDEAAWAAISRVQPLELSDDTLTLGLASGDDLNRFKADGAGPLREALVAALGIQVKYLPRKVPAVQPHNSVPPTTPPAAVPREQMTDPAEDPDPAALVTSRASAVSPASTAAVVEDRLEARLGAVLGRIAPRSSETSFAQPQAAAAQAPQQQSHAAAVNETEFPEPPEDPYAQSVPNPPSEIATVDSQHVGSSTASDLETNAEAAHERLTVDAITEGNVESTASATATGSDLAPAAEAVQQVDEVVIPEPTSSAAVEPVAVTPRSTPAPAFVRYGESVVREVLGARFVEERPLTTTPDPQ